MNNRIERLVHGDQRGRLQREMPGTDETFRSKYKYLLGQATEIQDNMTDYTRKFRDLRVELYKGMPSLVDRQSLTMFELSGTGFSQFASRVSGGGIAYFKKCLEKDMPELVVDNLNRWLEKSASNELFLRTYKGELIAALTTSYTKVDHREVLEGMFTGLHTTPLAGIEEQFDIERFTIDEHDMEIRLVDKMHSVVDETAGRELSRPGFVLGNGQTGRKAVTIDYMVYTLVCSNGLFIGKNKGRLFYRKHTGWEDWKFKSQIRDTVSQVRDFTDYAQQTIDAARRFKEDEIKHRFGGDKWEEVLGDYLQDKTGLDEDEVDLIFKEWQEKYELNLWGLTSAVTEYAQKFNHERQREIEQEIGRVVTLVV